MLEKNKEKTFLFSFYHLGMIPLVIGIVFLCAVFVVRIIPIDPYSINVTVNGVPQPPTLETVASFRNVFSLAFGIAALFSIIPGLIFVLGVAEHRKKRRRLKAEGLRMVAQATKCETSGVYVYRGFAASRQGSGFGFGFGWGVGWSSCRGNSRRGRRRQFLVRLHCEQKDFDGTTSQSFRSSLLREDPTPRLSDGRVIVYRDRENPSCYFVDVDESVGVQT